MQRLRIENEILKKAIAIFAKNCSVLTAFIWNHLKDYTLSQLCSVLKFPRSTYYAALVRVLSNKQIKYEVFTENSV